jgi:hypothetical protein
MQEQELFQGYEVRNWDFSPRLYKILAFSAIFNVLALLVVAQSNLLTTKGCDSPLVGGVCQVLDTLVVGGRVLTTDREMVNEPYEKTELPSADEIVWIPVAEDPFNYPEGYFALSNPELMMAPQEIPGDGTFPSTIPGIPNPTTGGSTDLMNQPQVLPPSNPNAVTKLPDSPFEINGNPTIPKRNTRIRTPRPGKTQKNQTLSNNSPNTLPDLTQNPTANTDEKDPNKTVKPNPTEDKVAEVVINKKPMKDFAAVVKTKFDKKEVDLNQNFKVVAEGVLTKEGKLDLTPDKKTKQPRSRILAKEGNPQMIAIAEQAIAAIGDSGWLGYLRNQGVEKINFTVVQDNDNLQVIITSDLATPERANTVSSGLNGAIQAAFFADKNNLKKLGEDEKTLLSNAKVAVNPQNTKQFVLNFVIPKPLAQEMITRKLNEPQEPSTENKPNGSTAQVKENRQNAAK